MAIRKQSTWTCSRRVHVVFRCKWGVRIFICRAAGTKRLDARRDLPISAHIVPPVACIIFFNMKPLRRSVALALTIFLLSTGCAKRIATANPPAPPPPAPRVAARAAELTLPPERPAGSCKSVNGFPDSTCTPGEVDPRVTQTNIKTTICVSGYTATVRPPTTYTNALKVQQIREYGYTDAKVGDYEEDHFIPLELGGNPTDPRNLWPELGPTPNPKDTVEGKLKRLVCSNKMTLDEAQKRIRTNWKTAIQ
jgi:hypothetical protein